MSISNWVQTNLTRGPGLIIGYVVVTLLPTLMCILMTYQYLGLPPTDFVPSFPNDFANYFHEIESYINYGFDTGYYSAMEAIPKLDFRMGMHGPLYPFLIGNLAVVFGWEYHSPVLYNLGFLTLAMIVFLFLVRPKGLQLAAMAGMLVTFWPLHLHTPSAYQESLHHSFAIVLAALGVRYIDSKESERFRWFAGLFGTILFLSLIRFSWSFFFFPLIFAELRRRRKSTVLPTLVIGTALTFSLVKFNGLFVPSSANVITGAINQLSGIPMETLRIILNTFVSNLLGFFDHSEIEFLLRFEILFLAIFVPVIYLALKLRRSPKLQQYFPEAWLHVFLASTILWTSLFLYWDHGFYRVFSVVFVFSCFFALARKHLSTILLITILHCAAASGLGAFTEGWIPNFAVDREQLVQTKTAMSVLKFRSKARSPWCNTILTPLNTFDHRIAQAPAGFGLSNYHPAFPPLTIKSKYVLLKAWDYDQLPGRQRLVQLFVLPDKDLTLYENPQSQCQE